MSYATLNVKLGEIKNDKKEKLFCKEKNKHHESNKSSNRVDFYLGKVKNSF